MGHLYSEVGVLQMKAYGVGVLPACRQDRMMPAHSSLHMLWHFVEFLPINNTISCKRAHQKKPAAVKNLLLDHKETNNYSLQ